MRAADASEASPGAGQMLEGDRVGVRSRSAVSGRLQINSRHRGFLHAIFFFRALRRAAVRRRRGRLEEWTAAAEVPSFLLSLSTTGGRRV